MTQFDKDDVETIGLVKFDFLGLRTLTVIDRALKSINEYLAESNKESLDLSTLSLDDPKVFELLGSGRTTAVFQLESTGMRELIRRLKPTKFEEIVALLALYRPGPLESGMHDEFVDRKHGKSTVTFPHELLAPVLSETYGVILYQEQVMQAAQVLAGYSLGQADILRRAMGKKKIEEMEQQRQIFVDGCSKNEIKKIQILPLSLSYDHRVINGVDAGNFMLFIKNKLEYIDKALDDFYWYDRDVFKLYYYEGNTLSGLAKKTGISRNSLFTTIDKVREQLKDLLDE